MFIISFCDFSTFRITSFVALSPLERYPPCANFYFSPVNPSRSVAPQMISLLHFCFFLHFCLFLFHLFWHLGCSSFYFTPSLCSLTALLKNVINCFVLLCHLEPLTCAPVFFLSCTNFRSSNFTILAYVFPSLPPIVTEMFRIYTYIYEYIHLEAKISMFRLHMIKSLNFQSLLYVKSRNFQTRR